MGRTKISSSDVLLGPCTYSLRYFPSAECCWNLIVSRMDSSRAFLSYGCSRYLGLITGASFGSADRRVISPRDWALRRIVVQERYALSATVENTGDRIGVPATISKSGTEGRDRYSRVSASRALNSSESCRTGSFKNPANRDPWWCDRGPLPSLSQTSRARIIPSESFSNVCLSLSAPSTCTLVMARTWSCRFLPTPGSSCTTLMPWASSSAAFPIPDNSRSLGLSTAPAHSMTSFSAKAFGANSHHGERPTRGSLFRLTLATISKLKASCEFPLEEQFADPRIFPHNKIFPYIGKMGCCTRCAEPIGVWIRENSHSDWVTRIQVNVSGILTKPIRERLDSVFPMSDYIRQNLGQHLVRDRCPSPRLREERVWAIYDDAWAPWRWYFKERGLPIVSVIFCFGIHVLWVYCRCGGIICLDLMKRRFKA